MTAAAITIDPATLDVLAHPEVVDAVSRLVGWEREIRKQYAAVTSESEFTSQTEINAARTRMTSNVAQARHEQAQVRERLASRVNRLVEELVRASEES